MCSRITWVTGVYSPVLAACVDLDECSLGGQVCTQTARCENTYGSYRCVCKEGFEQESDSETCRGNLMSIYFILFYFYYKTIVIHAMYNRHRQWQYWWNAHVTENLTDCGWSVDIDECGRPGMCQHTCRNTWGSFQCLCDEGYHLAADARSCDGICTLQLCWMCLLQNKRLRWLWLWWWTYSSSYLT